MSERNRFDLGDLAGGEERSETIEKTFTLDGPAHLQLRNVSGDSRITVGADGEIGVRARKRVRGASEERAKRLLENVEIRMEQSGNEVSVRPHLYEQDRGWLDLFRGGRVAVDFDITVPRGSHIDATTVSGDLDVRGTRGPLEVQSVSGDVTLSDIQGPIRLKMVSGDASCTEVAGALEANSVSGDLTFDRCRLHGCDILTVSGDVGLTGDLDAGCEHRLKTISGDVALALVGSSYDVRFKTMSGDLDCDLTAVVTREGRRDQHVLVGGGAARVTVKTVSGDLQLRPGGGTVPEASAACGATVPSPDPEATLRMDPPETGGAGAREGKQILQLLADGKIDPDQAFRLLRAIGDIDDPAGPLKPPAPPGPSGSATGPGAPAPSWMRGRVLRVMVTSGGKSKVNIAVPLAIARIGKAKLATSGLVRGHLAKFGLDLDELLDNVQHSGPLIDVSDGDDRVIINVE